MYLKAPILASLASGAMAASIVKVADFGTNPTGLTMEVYVPDKLAAKPSIIVAMHGCGGTGQQYARMTKYQPLAETRNFIVVYPSSRRDNNCWDVASAGSLRHDGGGDSQGLASMVRYLLGKYGADPAKVFATGSSSGCMMSNVLLATYPDVFAAASCYSGVAAGCLAGSPGASPQTADPACASGQHVKTGAEWAGQVRDMYKGYNGTYPRMQTWHGKADTFVSYLNLAEQLKEWGALLGVEFTKNVTDTPQKGYTQMVYGDGTKLVAYSAEGVGHTVPVHEELDLKWFGI